jgi:integrase
MRHIFPSRLRVFLNACNLPTDSFNRRHPLSQLLRYGTVTAVLRGIPPFIIDTAIGNVLTRPVTPSSYRRIFENTPPAGVLRADKAPGPARRGRISARTRIQGTGLELFETLETLRSRLRHSEDSRTNRETFIHEITSLIGPAPFQPIPGPPTQKAIFEANARVFGGFIAFLLRSKLKISSVLTRTSAIATAFPDLFGSTPLWTWTAPDYANALRLGMEEHETDHFRAAFKWLVAFLNESGMPTPQISWHDDDPQTPLIVTPAPLVGFVDFNRALDTCLMLDTIPDHLRELLQIMLILGFWVGLRAKEASRLTLRHYHPHPFHLIEVRNSKFPTSTRDMYLRYIVAQPYLRRLNAWYITRLNEANGNLDAPFLGTGRHMRSDSRKNPLGFYDSSYLSGQAGLILRCTIGEPISFHGLRHAFVSWLLLRLLATDGRITFKRSIHPWASPQAFSPEAYASLRPLLHGFSTPQPGQSECSHILMVICRLVGHADPTTTLQDYCHTVDIAHALLDSHLGGRG